MTFWDKDGAVLAMVPYMEDYMQSFAVIENIYLKACFEKEIHILQFNMLCILIEK